MPRREPVGEPARALLGGSRRGRARARRARSRLRIKLYPGGAYAFLGSGEAKYVMTYPLPVPQALIDEARRLALIHQQGGSVLSSASGHSNHLGPPQLGWVAVGAPGCMPELGALPIGRSRQHRGLITSVNSNI